MAGDTAEAAVRAFYAAFNAHDWERAADFTTEDWEHINPFGGWARRRAAVLAELRVVHGAFLHGVSDTPETLAVSVLSPEAALVTVTSRMSRYTTPDGVPHDNERHIRTFVVMRQDDGWRVRLDQNTLIRD